MNQSRTGLNGQIDQYGRGYSPHHTSSINNQNLQSIRTHPYKSILDQYSNQTNKFHKSYHSNRTTTVHFNADGSIYNSLLAPDINDINDGFMIQMIHQINFQFIQWK